MPVRRALEAAVEAYHIWGLVQEVRRQEACFYTLPEEEVQAVAQVETVKLVLDLLP
jgi:hypothetical protein